MEFNASQLSFASACCPDLPGLLFCQCDDTPSANASLLRGINGDRGEQSENPRDTRQEVTVTRPIFFTDNGITDLRQRK